ncbi:MAG TPA: hypothetical protein VJ842_20010 [Pyrinomonadaceae bacterium]|nr:hypothetical protein [Pyrinomonadaceae bacterium]
MSSLASEFSALAPEYQQLLLQAQDSYDIKITPLQQISGGRSGAILYLVSVSQFNQSSLRHLILKLDTLKEWHKKESSEVERHRLALNESPQDFSQAHLAQFAFEPIEINGRTLIFYTIAGDSLQRCRPASAYAQQNQLQAIFGTVSDGILSSWQKNLVFENTHPQSLLEQWLGYRIREGEGNINDFYEHVCHLNTNVDGLIVQGQALPNPLLFARERDRWRNVRLLDAARGFLHGDLHMNNVISKFSLSGDDLETYFFIDLAQFEKDGFLFYDHLYFELSYLIQQVGHVLFSHWVDFILLLAERDIPKIQQLSADITGIYASVRASREAIYKWVITAQSTLGDDMWGQFWLGATAAGLNFCNKAGLSNEERLAALIYASAHLKRYFNYFKMPMPTHAVELKLTDQVLPVNVKTQWDGFVSACHDFDKDRGLYFLITGPQAEADLPLLSAIGRIGWSAVLDFDPNTQDQGLYKHASSELRKHRSLHLMTFEEDVPLNPKRATYWYAARGLTGRSSTLPEDNGWIKWNRMYYQHLQKFFSDVASTVGSLITVVVLWDNLEYVRKVCDFIDQVFGDRAEFVIAVPNPQRFDSLASVYNTQSFPLSGRQIAIGIRSLIITSAPSADYVLVPAPQKSMVALPPEDVNFIEEEMVLIHLGLGINEEEGRQAGYEFLRGGRISWFELSLHYDVERDKTSEVKEQVQKDLEGRQPTRINLYHFPGAGGSTISLRVAWDLHKEYPTVLLQKVSPYTLERLRKLYSYSGLPILAVIESSDVLGEFLEPLYAQVETEHIPVVFLVVTRRSREIASGTPRSMYVRERLNEAEANRFAKVYTEEEPSRRRELEELAHNETMSRLRVPFFFGLTAFGEDFIRLQPYVRTRLENMEEIERKIMCYLSLAYRYAQKSIPAQMFTSILGLSSSRIIQLEKFLQPERLSLLVKEDYGEWRPAHVLIGNEIVEQILAGNSQRENWRQNLSTWVTLFIEDSIGLKTSAFIIDLLKRLFIYRGDREELIQEIGEKSTFSRLIQDISSPEGRLSVLQKLADMYPDETHFAGHLARFLSTEHDHQRALEYANSAIKLAPNDDVLRHIKGVVLRNWAYSIMVRVEHNLKGGKSTFAEDIDRINEFIQQAEKEFTMSRELNPDREHGYVSHIQLLTRSIEFGYKRSGKATMLEFLSDPTFTQYQDMIDRAETVLEEVRRLRAGRPPGRFIEDCENEMDLFYGNYSDVLQSWNSMLETRDIYKPPVRRRLVRAYLSRTQRSWDTLSNKDLKRIYDLMEQNLLEEPEEERNIRLWFNAARRIATVSIDSAIERLVNLYSTTKPLDAIYYLYVLYTLKAIDGSDTAKKRAEVLIKESQFIARHKPKGGFSFEWMGPGLEMTRLVHYTKLGNIDDTTGFYNDVSPLVRVRGKIAKASKPEAGLIELQCGLTAFFVPQPRRAPASFGPQDVNKNVDFYLGFSYEGLRAWSVNLVS